MQGSKDDGDAERAIRRRVEVRLTKHEQEFIREQAERLHMTMSEYILKCSVYDAQAARSGARDPSAPLVEKWEDAWAQMREASMALSDLREQSAYLARDTRSALARGLSRRLAAMCDAVEGDMASALASLGTALGEARKRRP